MYELIQVSEHDYYIDCPAKIGLVDIGGGEVVAIDSGSDKDAGKKVLKQVDARGWKLRAVFNTHSHADHIGGNKLLQDRTGCAVYVPGLELAYTLHPELESMTLWGGRPPKELQTKFLLAQPSRAEALTDAALPAGMSSVPLPGHSFGMVGYRTADGNLFLADCVSSEETLAKYGVSYLWDPEESIAALETVKTLSAGKFIPSHAPVTEDIVPLAELNIASIRALEENILRLSAAPLAFEELLSALFETYGMELNASQYGLIGSTLRSCLACLAADGRMKSECVGTRMLWTSV